MEIVEKLRWRLYQCGGRFKERKEAVGSAMEEMEIARVTSMRKPGDKRSIQSQ